MGCLDRGHQPPVGAQSVCLQTPVYSRPHSPLSDSLLCTLIQFLVKPKPVAKTKGGPQTQGKRQTFQTDFGGRYTNSARWSGRAGSLVGVKSELKSVLDKVGFVWSGLRLNFVRQTAYRGVLTSGWGPLKTLVLWFYRLVLANYNWCSYDGFWVV